MDELYVLARRVLLDALEALDSHRHAIVLVGAQAVYLRVGEADLAVAPFSSLDDCIRTATIPGVNTFLQTEEFGGCQPPGPRYQR